MKGLIKETSKIQRNDTLADLQTLNEYLYWCGRPQIKPLGSSVKLLENCVALGIGELQGVLPLRRGHSFYKSIVKEITIEEKAKWNKLNSGKKCICIQ